jgi:ComF family protein
MLKFVKELFFDLAELIYPNLCRCCLENGIKKDNNYFCVACHSKMPYTHDIDKIDNDLMYHFYGRVPIERATALLWYAEGGVVQQMIHNMKYKGIKEIGFQLGTILGKNIFESGLYKSIDLFIPVPMHYKKQMQRGFNQAELIAESISNETNVPYFKNILVKEKETITQTRKSRKERVLNTSSIYNVMNRSAIKGKHIMIVDDVVTTGSTIEACATVLLKNGAAQISVACIAMGNRYY